MTKKSKMNSKLSQTALARKAMIPYYVSLTKTDAKPIDLRPVERERRTEEMLLMAQKEIYSIHGVWNDDEEIISIMLMAAGRREALERAIAIRTKVLEALMWKPTEFAQIKWSNDENDFEPDQL